MRFLTLNEVLAWFKENSVLLTVMAAVLTIVALALLIRWTIKGRRVPAIIRVVGPLMGIAWNAEATYEVLRRALGVPPLVAGVGFAVFEMLMIGAAVEAEAHYNRRKREGDPNPTLGPAKYFVFTIAFLTATAAAFNTTRAPVVIFRYAVAIAVTWYWALKFMRDHEGGQVKRTTWALSPRRIAVRIGLIDPTDADLAQVHHERQVRLLVSLARKIFHGVGWLRTWREGRFARAAELADEKMMAEVVTRITRAEMALELADPQTSEKRLTALAQQADARRRALLMPPPAIGKQLNARLADDQTLTQPVGGTGTGTGTGTTEAETGTGTGTSAAEVPESGFTEAVDKPSWTPPAVPLTILQRAGSAPVDAGSGTFGTVPGTAVDGDRNNGEFEELVRDLDRDWTARIDTHRDDLVDVDQDRNRERNRSGDLEGEYEDDTVEPGKSKKELARAAWDAALAVGRRPTGSELAEVSGASDSMGRRWARQWSAEAGLDAPVSGSPINGHHVA